MVSAIYGPPEVLQLKEVERPVPRGTELGVQAHAVFRNYGEWSMLRGKPFFLRLTEAGL